MTKTEFAHLCESLTIHPEVALENDEVHQVLYEMNNGGAATVEHLVKILEEQF